MNTLAEAFRLINNLVRIGTVTEVDVARARARVKAGDNVTGWQPWVSARTGTTLEWNPPTVGEQVVLLSPSGDLAQAIIITGLYQQNAPSASADEHKTVYPDGASFTYNHVQKSLTAVLPGAVNVNITGNATVNIGEDATVAVGGICKVDGEKIHLNDGVGVVTGAHKCLVTGTPHLHFSSTVTAGE